MKFQLGIIIFTIFTFTVVLSQLTEAAPDRHERNRCRPPNCKPPSRREPGDRDYADRKISEKDEVLVEDNSLKLDQTTTTTTEKSLDKIQVVISVVITPAPTNISESDSGNSSSTPFVIPSNVVVTSPEEIHIPVEVRIIPPSRDELGGLEGHCPKPFRYHNETGMCFIPGKAAEHPCGENMQFYAQPGSDVYGDCDCKPYAGCDFRPLLYYSEKKRCYHLFEQGPCSEGEWLILNENSGPICQKRPCPANEEIATTPKSWLSLNGTCYQLGTQGFCTSPDETVQYASGGFTPSCSPIPIKSPACSIHRTIVLGAGALPCAPGHKSTGSGGCGTIVGF